LLAVQPEQFECRHRRVVGGVEDRAVDAICAQGTDQGLSDVGVVDEVESLVQRPVAGPHQRLGEVGVALPVHEGEAHDESEAILVVQRAQASFCFCLARRVGARGFEVIVLACWAVSAGAVDEVGAGVDEPVDAGCHRCSSQFERGVLVHCGRLFVGDAAEGGCEMHDCVDALDRSAAGVAVAEVADQDLHTRLV
jgi:hypothetical protein